MSYLPITLGIAGIGDAQSSNSPLKLDPALRQKVHDRDDDTCRCCGFRASKYQEILYINGNFNDRQIDNLATVCFFCQQAFYLDLAASMRSGVLIWLPEISQAELSHLMRAIYIGRIAQGPMADTARQAMTLLLSRREDAVNRLGSEDPGILATVMQDFLTPGIYKQRKAKLDGIRLLPLDKRIIREDNLEFNQFPQILAYWRSKNSPFYEQMPVNWVPIFQKMQDAA